MSNNEQVGPGSRFRDSDTGQMYIQMSEQTDAGSRTRTRLYEDGTVRVDHFGVDEPGQRHAHAIDEAHLERGDDAWTATYRREQGGRVVFDREAAAKREALIEEAGRLRDSGASAPADVHRLRAQWRNTGSTGDPARDRRLEHQFRGLLDRGRDRGRRGR